MTKYVFTFLLFYLFIVSCNKEGPCDNVVCHIGNCNNGVCVCPDGFTGDDCGVQITPSKILVSAIRVLQFPETMDNGDPWDDASGPDLIISLAVNNIEFWTSSVSFTDVELGEVYSFGSIPPLQITEVETTYELGLFDLDGTDSELIGSYSFQFYTSNNGFPTLPILGNSPLIFELDLDYEW